MNHLQCRINIGTLGVTWSGRDQISRIDWYDIGPVAPVLGIAAMGDEMRGVHCPPQVALIIKKLKKYFNEGEPIGKIDPDWLDRSSWSDFQKRVYDLLIKIPHGETRTYAWVADMMGSAKRSAPRPVGQALRRNPVPILVPCHRIVSTGDMGGFMGTQNPDSTELRLKRWLIDHENQYLNPHFPFFPALSPETHFRQ